MREIPRQAMIEPHIKQNPGIAPVRRRQAGFGCQHLGMGVGIGIDGAMQPDAADHAGRIARRIGLAMYEVAEHPTQTQGVVVADQQDMRQMIHPSGQRIGVAVMIVRMNSTEFPSDPASFPDVAASFMLTGPVGKLETATDLAERADARGGVAVICHPLTSEGGSMHNKVVTMIERAVRESGLDTVRFNFREAGNSEGSFDKGRGEREDLAAIVAWVRRVRPHDTLWLAGFSFGSFVSISQAVPLRADALISVAPPAGRYEFGTIALPTCPWLIVQGEADEVVEPQAVFDWVDSMEHKPDLVRMPETSHFFHRRLMDLRGAIKHAVRGWLPPPRQA